MARIYVLKPQQLLKNGSDTEFHKSVMIVIQLKLSVKVAPL